MMQIGCRSPPHGHVFFLELVLVRGFKFKAREVPLEWLAPAPAGSSWAVVWVVGEDLAEEEWGVEAECGGSSGGGGGRSRKGKGKMRAAAGDVVSPPGEEAARQLKDQEQEQEQFEGACQESPLTARRHESSRAAGSTGSSSSGSGSSSSGGAGQAAGTRGGSSRARQCPVHSADLRVQRNQAPTGAGVKQPATTGNMQQAIGNMQ
jgi:hypothetical protein